MDNGVHSPAAAPGAPSHSPAQGIPEGGDGARASGLKHLVYRAMRPGLADVNARLDALATRLTMPLAALEVAHKVPTALCPVIMVKGKRLHALAHYAAPLPAKVLRRPVDNVAAQASTLVSAMDAVLSGI